MGLFDYVEIDTNIELPEFPGEPQDLEWQSKTINAPLMDTYKISNDGRLLKKKQEKRKMTEDEIRKKANEHGFESWEEWENSDNTFGPLDNWKYTVKNEYWIDQNRHGSFEFHASSRHIKENDDNTFWSYEARFTDGDLDGIILLKPRN